MTRFTNRFDVLFNRLPFATIGWTSKPGPGVEQRVIWLPHPMYARREIRLPIRRAKKTCATG